MSLTIHKTCLVVLKDRRVLVVRRKNKKVFFFPGGRRRPGEFNVDVLARETQQELGCAIDRESLRPLKTFYGPTGYRGVNLYMNAFMGKLKEEPRVTEETEEIRWIDTTSFTRLSPVGEEVLKWLHERNLVE